MNMYDSLVEMLDLNDENISDLYKKWCEGNLHITGLIRILLIQEIQNEKSKPSYDGRHNNLLGYILYHYRE